MTNPSTATKCPACGAFSALAIIYGYPSAELLSKAKQGLVALGGCVTTVWEVNDKEVTFDPDWRCGVAAICPTCHRRIHNGVDGHEVNERLALAIAALDSR